METSWGLLVLSLVLIMNVMHMQAIWLHWLWHLQWIKCIVIVIKHLKQHLTIIINTNAKTEQQNNRSS